MKSLLQQHRDDIHRRMIAVGLTRMELARRSKVDITSIRRFFNGTRATNPTVRTLEKLLKVIRQAEGRGVREEVTRLAEIGERRRQSQMSR